MFPRAHCRRKRRAHYKEATPLKKAPPNRRDHAKIAPRAQRHGRLNCRISKGFAGKLAVFVEILEMAVRQPLQHQFPALAVDKSGSGTARDNGADRGHGYARGTRRTGEHLKAIRWDGAKNFVIVTAGNDSLEADSCAGEQGSSSGR